MNTRNGILPVALLLLAACAPGESEEAVAKTSTKDSIAVAPAIVPPDETAGEAQPPSYEVAIASAAAERNKSLERCASQPRAVRAQCEQEANAAFSEHESGLQDLRGNQQ